MAVNSSHCALTLEGVTKVFPSGTQALDETSLSIQPGQFVAVVGPSGCGKSTLLRLVAGLAEPTQGTITQDLDNDAQLGFVFQEPTLMPWASVFENIALPFRLKGQSPEQIEEDVARVIDWVGLSDFASAYPRELSGGMKMRTSIARALVGQPNLLLLDEPFAALDEFTREKLNDELLRLWAEQHWTALFVTHSVREAAYLADRILVMSPRPGRIVADIEVPFEHPRDAGLRNNPSYSKFCAMVSDSLVSDSLVQTQG